MKRSVASPSPSQGEGWGEGRHGTTLGAALASARRRLRRAGIDDADLEAELLLRHALSTAASPSLLAERGQGGEVAPVSRAYLLSRLGQRLEPAAAARFEAYLQRRLAHEPSAYITGHREFYGLDFFVSPATLIPRPETETLVEAAIELVSARDVGAQHAAPLLIADVGTGCGAVAVALACALPGATVLATDASSAALAVAATNAQRHGVADRIVFAQADLLAPLAGPFDLIVANLPYVQLSDWRRLPPEVRDHEPRLALDGGRDGLDQLRRLLRQAPSRLRAGGSVCLEFGAGQEAPLRALAAAAFPNASLAVKPDLAARPRVLVLR